MFASVSQGLVRAEGCANEVFPRDSQGKSIFPWWEVGFQGIVGGYAGGSWSDSGTCDVGYTKSLSNVLPIGPMQPRTNDLYGILAVISGITVAGILDSTSGFM